MLDQVPLFRIVSRHMWRAYENVNNRVFNVNIQLIFVKNSLFKVWNLSPRKGARSGRKSDI